MTLSGICISLRIVGNVSCAGRGRDLCGDLSLEGLQHHLLELVGLLGAEALVSTVGELLGFKAATSVELHFESLTAAGLDPLTVDALVLFASPGILEFVQFKALVFQARNVRLDTMTVVSLAVLKGV